MALNRQLSNLLWALLVAFLIVAVSGSYWAALERDRLLSRDDNPRNVQARAAIRRGAIYDRNGELLVRSEFEAGLPQRRVYLYPEFNSAIGYYSLRYGTGGLEAEHDRVLSGGDLPRSLEQVILRSPVIGSDIRLTYDLTLQRTVYQAMQGRQGAALVMGVSGGDLMALVSMPTFDPNLLDQQWNALIVEPGNPFFNRALQGRFQPGGMTQTALMGLFAVGGRPLDTLIPRASAPIGLGNLVLTCVTRPPETSLTLLNAYRYGCPTAFNIASSAFSEAQLVRALGQLNAASRPQVAEQRGPDGALTEEILGQGQQTVSPLDLALLTSAIINEGNSPSPYTLMAARRPGESEWRPAPPLQTSYPLMTAEAALALQSAMQQSASAQNLGSHVAIAYGGGSTLVWYTGFAITGPGQGVAVVVVLEQTRDVTEVSSIGTEILLAAQARSSPPFP